MAELFADALEKLAAALAKAHPEPETDPARSVLTPGDDPLVHELVYSMMLWESSAPVAIKAVTLLRAGVVDYNELRVCSLDEVASLLPRGYPMREARCERLLVALNAIFDREHALSLQSLQGMSKREARAYLDQVDGLPAFVAARVTLIGLGGHAVPLDSTIRSYLEDEGVLDSDTDLSAIGSKLDRAVRASDSLQFYSRMEQAIAARPPKSSKPRTRAASKKKSSKAGSTAGTKKTTRKKAPTKRQPEAGA